MPVDYQRTVTPDHVDPALQRTINAKILQSSPIQTPKALKRLERAVSRRAEEMLGRIARTPRVRVDELDSGTKEEGMDEGE